MSAIVSLLWPKNESVLTEFLAHSPPVIYTRAGLAATAQTFRTRALDSGVRIELLETMISEQRRGELRAEAKRHAHDMIAQASWTTLAERYPAFQLGPEALAEVLSPHLAERIADGMIMAEELAAASERSRIELVVLNEDVTAGPKAAAMWARGQSVPVLHLAHSCIIVGKLRTNHREFHSDIHAVFGERARIPYRDMGIPDHKLVITGNPAWDGFPGLVQQKDRVRAEARSRYGRPESGKIVLFATTYSANISAFNDPDLHERSVEDILRAHLEVVQAHPDTLLVIKGRVNHPNGHAQAKIIAQRLGVPQEMWRYEDSAIGPLIVAADIVISVDSNVSVEAMMAGVPALNYWRPASTLLGPFFRADDGVLDVSPPKIARAITSLFADPSITRTLRSMGSAKMADFAGPIDGGAGRRVAALMQQMRRQTANGIQRPPVSAANPSEPRTHPDAAQHDLVELFGTVPAMVLDLSAGGGALGELIKSRWNDARIIGIHGDAESAATARAHLDRTIVTDLDRADLLDFGIAPHSIDTVIAPDVLSRVRDPWRVLRLLKPLLSPNAQIVASVSNLRLITVIAALAKGESTYGDGGVLDIRNIRFFTLAGLYRLFEETGYRVARIERDIEPSLTHLHLQPGARGTINMPVLQFKDLSDSDLLELKTRRYRVVIQPV